MNKGVLLFLDDIRNPFKNPEWLTFSPISPDKVVWVKSYYEFINWITENGLPDAICFDHDLGAIEEWKKHKDFPNYEFSSFGNVKKNGINIKLSYRENGSRFIYKRKEYSVHRVIAKLFIPNPHNKPQVNHIDGNRWNNIISNLEWCTNSENVKHSYDFLEREFTAFGENHNNSKSVTQYSKSESLINVFGGVNEAGRQLNIQFTNIAKCARGERKTAGGFIWRYENKKPNKKAKIKHIAKSEKNYSSRFSIPPHEEKTGYDAAKWLVEYCIDNNLKLPLYNIQSANFVGKENIRGLLEGFRKYGSI